MRRHATLLAGGTILLLVSVMAGGAGWLFPGDPFAMIDQPLLWPGAAPGLPLGTDSLGRDIAADLFHGARASLLIGLASTGKLKWRETIAEGIEKTPAAFLGLLSGKNFGKQLVKLT